jgi:hypothetical protein
VKIITLKIPEIIASTDGQTDNPIPVYPNFIVVGMNKKYFHSSRILTSQHVCISVFGLVVLKFTIFYR